MEYVEESNALLAKGYARPLKYTTDKSLADPRWPFRYVYDQGALRCSEAAVHKDRTCYVARGTEVTLAKESPSFVYLDVGCWADDADGKGTKRRDFGLVCGQHVYLCEFVGRPEVPSSRVPSVRDFFEGLAIQGCGVRVISYARARNFTRTPSCTCCSGTCTYRRWLGSAGGRISSLRRSVHCPRGLSVPRRWRRRRTI
jgi:hypothetical protein